MSCEHWYVRLRLVSPAGSHTWLDVYKYVDLWQTNLVWPAVVDAENTFATAIPSKLPGE